MVFIANTLISFQKTTHDFSTLWQTFSPGDVEKRRLLRQCAKIWSFFERNLVGLADFAGSKFERMANWPSFDQKIETGRIRRIEGEGDVLQRPREQKPAKVLKNPVLFSGTIIVGRALTRVTFRL